MNTKTALIVAAGLSLVGATAFAAGKPCDELKTEIAAKLDAKKITGYALDIVDADKADANAKVVGTCESGAKKVIYSKK